jgi:hypothetical protein
MFLLLLVAVITASPSAFSTDLEDYTVRETYEYWESFDDGKSFGNGNAIWGKITLPNGFAFNYDNTDIQTVYVYGDGWLSFNGTNYSPTEILNFAGHSNMISWYGEPITTMGSLSYKFEGEAPYRKLIIQHLDAKVKKDHANNTFDAQVILYETSNEITVVYGDNTGIGRKGADGALYFVGDDKANYINIRPDAPFDGYTVYKSDDNPNTGKFLNKDTRDWIYEGRAWTISPEPTIASVYPLSGSVLVRGNKYSGDDRPHVRINRAESQDVVKFSYEISGPVGSDDEAVIYRAVSDDVATDTWITPDPQPEGNAQKIYIDHANELCGLLSDGTLDLETKADEIIGGRYKVTVVLELENDIQRTYESFFTIALENDLEVVDIIYPIVKGQTIYPYNVQAPVEVKLRNLGNRSLTKFEVVANIEHIETKSITKLTHIFDSSVPPTQPLKRGETYFVSTFDNTFTPDKIGDYKISIETKLLDAAGDDDDANNIFPVGDKTHEFTVGYDYEGEVLELVGIEEGKAEYVNTPVGLGFKLKNNGSIDLAGYKLKVEILDPAKKVVKNMEILVDNIPTRFNNEKIFNFDEPFFPETSGKYTINVDFDIDADVVPSNNTKTFTFDVEEGLKGKYTIKKDGGDFATLGAAVSALYNQGVAGAVEFVFQDTEYTEGEIDAFVPAIDLSSKIIGVTAENTVTFKIDENDALAEVVTINLKSALGIGVLFGQNSEPTNNDAPVNWVAEENRKEFANSEGYITFDGSANKLLKFIIHSNNDAREVFYIANGAKNITLKNLIIEDHLVAYNSDIPSMRFNTGLDKFEFEENTNLTTGVLIRNLPPMSKLFGINSLKLDTLTINNIVVDNNIIHGFGVGVTTVGIGALVDAKSGDFVTKYNHNNTISNNVIYDVAKTGVFAGYEDNLNIKGNRIFDVHGNGTPIAAGIMTGIRLTSTPYYNMNNVNLVIDGNEVSNVSAEASISGIFVGQQTTKLSMTGNYFDLPATAENTTVINNLVWDLNPQEDETDVSGIFVTTAIDDKLTPKEPAYFTSNDFIANNTVIIDDNDTDNNGDIFGIGIINSQNPELYNNAIAMSDETISDDKLVNAAVYYYGLFPRWGDGLVSDRNALQIENTNSDLFYMTQIDRNGKIIYKGLKDEFTKMNQWFYWTNQDANSIVGDVESNYELYSNNPSNDPEILTVLNQRIAVPTVKNSILNNRGRNLVDEVPFDIDGMNRGNSDERYDIGAVEFIGKVYVKDMELVRVTAPGVYKAEEGKFSNNEYIMTTAPVDINVNLRNNSSMSVTSPKVHVKVYHETFDGELDPSKNVVLDYSITVPSVGSFHSADVDITDINHQFKPETYGDWRRTDGSQPFDVPVEYRAMESNVSPLYKIIITLEDDENADNNVIEKTVRFYLKRAELDIMVSSKYLKYQYITADNDMNHRDGQMNLDSLERVFNTFGWSTKLGPEPENDHLDVDIFDRTEWEPRSINYPIYRSLFWTDGHDTDADDNLNTLSNYDAINLIDYLKAGNKTDKKNFVSSCQEFVRNNADIHTELFNKYFRLKNGEFNSPLADGQDYNGKFVTGMAIAKGQKFEVKSTELAFDNPPVPGLDSLVIDETSLGNVKIAFTYDEHQKDRPSAGKYVDSTRRIAATMTSMLGFNVIHANVDWRHWGDPNKVVRAITDYLANNGVIFPVELASFDALATANKVDLNWATASELNSDRFEIERADAEGNTAISMFTNIANVPAANQSSVMKYYSLSDINVQSGNRYAYRLKMLDNTGEYTYSDVEFVTVEGLNGSLSVDNITPNPVSATSNVEYTVSNTMNVTVEMYDMTGRIVKVFANNTTVNAGTYTISINSANFTSGAYTLVFTAGDNVVTKTVNIVK